MPKQVTCPHCKHLHSMEPRDIARECPSVRRVEYNEAGAVVAIEYYSISDYMPSLSTIPDLVPKLPPAPIVGDPIVPPYIVTIGDPPGWNPATATIKSNIKVGLPMSRPVKDDQ